MFCFTPTATTSAIGQPVLEGVRIVGDVVDHQSTKVYVQHFRRRKNERRLRGHRQWHIARAGQAYPPAGPGSAGSRAQTGNGPGRPAVHAGAIGELTAAHECGLGMPLDFGRRGGVSPPLDEKGGKPRPYHPRLQNREGHPCGFLLIPAAKRCITP